MSEMKKDLDSTTYRKLLEFIKKEGVEPVRCFWIDYKEVQRKSLVFDALCDGKHPTLSLVMKHKAIAGFIKGLNTHNYPCFLLESKFPAFLDRISEENISAQIDGARSLEELGVHSVSLGLDIEQSNTYRPCVEYDSDGKVIKIIKYYSNGDISYEKGRGVHRDNWESYEASIKFLNEPGNFVLSLDTVGNSYGCRYASVDDFTFDTSLLPNEEELSRMAVPKTLADSKVYVKR